MSTETTNSTPTQDERVMGALAHIGTFIPTIGVIIPIVIWITQKDKSRYAAFQALQAAAYQLALLLLWFLGMACYMGSIFLMVPVIAMSQSSNFNPEMLFAFLPLGIIGFIGLFWLASLIYGIVAAVRTFQGKDFRYILIGKQIERFYSK